MSYTCIVFVLLVYHAGEFFRECIYFRDIRNMPFYPDTLRISCVQTYFYVSEALVLRA